MRRSFSAAALVCAGVMSVTGLLTTPAGAAPVNCVTSLEAAEASSGETVISIGAGDFAAAEVSNDIAGTNIAQAEIACQVLPQPTERFLTARAQVNTVGLLLDSSLPSTAGPVAVLLNENLGVLLSLYGAATP